MPTWVCSKCKTEVDGRCRPAECPKCKAPKDAFTKKDGSTTDTQSEFAVEFTYSY